MKFEKKRDLEKSINRECEKRIVTYMAHLEILIIILERDFREKM